MVIGGAPSDEERDALWRRAPFMGHADIQTTMIYRIMCRNTTQRTS
jgi:hypothetical protein